MPRKAKVNTVEVKLTKRGRAKKAIAAKTSVVPRLLPQADLDEIKSMAAAGRIKVDGDCPVCAMGEKKRAGCEEALLVVTAGGVTKDGASTVGQLACQYKVSSEALLRHRDGCMKREAVLALDKRNGGNEVENSAAWISKLAKYLAEVDKVLERENAMPDPDARIILAGAEEGRKICETNARMFIDLYKLRIDQKVQDDFMRIVLDVVDQVVPQAKEMIIEKLKGRLAVASASGAKGDIV